MQTTCDKPLVVTDKRVRTSPPIGWNDIVNGIIKRERRKLDNKWINEFFADFQEVRGWYNIRAVHETDRVRSVCSCYKFKVLFRIEEDTGNDVLSRNASQSAPLCTKKISTNLIHYLPETEKKEPQQRKKYSGGSWWTHINKRDEEERRRNVGCRRTRRSSSRHVAGCVPCARIPGVCANLKWPYGPITPKVHRSHEQIWKNAGDFGRPGNDKAKHKRVWATNVYEELHICRGRRQQRRRRYRNGYITSKTKRTTERIC